ncbi:MAG: LTA synthase family protein [Proteobacteria bacterium]|nr:LTA synthase family protein [Pseudomonadota bacterium]
MISFKQQKPNFSLLWLLLFFCALAFILRIFLLVTYRQEITPSFLEFSKIFSIGLFFDILTFGYIIVVPACYFLLVKRKFFNHRFHQIFLKILYFIAINIIIFATCSEVVFFDEFNVRFNFIAVDYLIYTTEVIGNIVESYPIIPIFASIIFLSSIFFWISRKQIVKLHHQSVKARLAFFITIFLLLSAEFFLFDASRIDKIFYNNYNREIAQNGLYQLFSAYRNNQIDFEKFYLSKDLNDANSELRDLISKQEPYAKFTNNNDIDKKILAKNHLNFKPNIIFVTLESMSAEYMQSFGSDKNITPNLDELAKKSLFFTNLKATGTRTVRGLEALTLSIPPTPGNSIVRRKNNENLFNIGTPFIERGYETKFIYGGDGYFDNMNYYFANNGFEAIDRPQFSDDEINFSNVWGVSDEDLYNKVISEADKSFAKNRPFFNYVLTTSNHRPFTYPEGKIDIPSKTNRFGAVKYADYAIGQLIKQAQNKPWFDKTIFVFIADHCAGSAGKTDLPVWRYQIPAMIYAPKIIKPQIYSENASQIDIPPTLLGIVGFDYQSKFFGVDLLRANKNYTQRAFISTYSDLGYFINNQLFMLELKKQSKVFDVVIKKIGYHDSQETITTNFSNLNFNHAIDYYQVANDYFVNRKLKHATQIH